MSNEGITGLLKELDSLLKLDRNDAECACASGFPANIDRKRTIYAERIVAARRLLGLSVEMNADGLLSGYDEAFTALQKEPSTAGIGQYDPSIRGSRPGGDQSHQTPRRESSSSEGT